MGVAQGQIPHLHDPGIFFKWQRIINIKEERKRNSIKHQYGNISRILVLRIIKWQKSSLIYQ